MGSTRQRILKVQLWTVNGNDWSHEYISQLSLCTRSFCILVWEVIVDASCNCKIMFLKQVQGWWYFNDIFLAINWSFIVRFMVGRFVSALYFRLQVCHMRRSAQWTNHVIATAAAASTSLGAWHMLATLDIFSRYRHRVLLYLFDHWQSTCLLLDMFMLMSEFNFRLTHQSQPKVDTHTTLHKCLHLCLVISCRCCCLSLTWWSLVHLQEMGRKFQKDKSVDNVWLWLVWWCPDVILQGCYVLVLQRTTSWCSGCFHLNKFKKPASKNIFSVEILVCINQAFFPKKTKIAHPRSLTARPWKMVLGRHKHSIGFRSLFRG